MLRLEKLGSWILTAALLGAAACGADEASVFTDETNDDLLFLHEEEKLARDVYLGLHTDTGLMLFQNIAASEQQHMDAVAGLIAARDLLEPNFDDTIGAFYDPQLRALYEQLMMQGRQSVEGALRSGATIEDLDIQDIEEMKARADSGDVVAVYASLQCGSRNHLRSFYGQLEDRGVGYLAQHISEAELTSIVTSNRESCGSR